MENKVVVHMKDGTIHKGLTHDFQPGATTFHLLPAEGGGVPVRIEVEGMKALFYVKDFLGNRKFVASREFAEAKRSGKKAILTFEDDESMWGTVPEDVGPQEAPGFFFFPVDEEDNNIRIYVVRSSLKEMRLVP